VRSLFCLRRSAFRLGLLAVPIGIGWAQINACDLVAPFGNVDAADVQAAINMSIGASPCTAGVLGAGVCNVAMVQRVVNASLSGNCVAGAGSVGHYATLNWTASASANVAGYNVYRGSAPGGPYTEVNSSLILSLTYNDVGVLAGQTYYYVATAVNNTGVESAYSNEAQSVIPSP
jgi:hypothetical protein